MVHVRNDILEVGDALGICLYRKGMRTREGDVMSLQVSLWITLRCRYLDVNADSLCGIVEIYTAGHQGDAAD